MQAHTSPFSFVGGARVSPVSRDGHKYKMVALDLDGTALNSYHQLSSRTIQFLRELDRKGFTIIIATGRPISTVLKHVAALDFPHPLPVVCSNGAKGVLCTCTKTKLGGDDAPLVLTKEVFYLPVPENIAKRTIQLSQELGFVTQYYHELEIVADPKEPHHFKLTELYKSKTGAKIRYVEPAEMERVCMDMGPPTKLLVLCDDQVQDFMMEAFNMEVSKPEFCINGEQPGATVVRGNLGWFLEILNADVNKGKGLQRMCKYLGIPTEDCIAFGDGDNDFEFLQMAGLGVVMKNGGDIVRAVASEETNYTNHQDGVIRHLQLMERGGRLVFDTKLRNQGFQNFDAEEFDCDDEDDDEWL